jgi:flagellar biosynthetic protein FlhB
VDQDRTEQATARRVQQAREQEGNVAVSTEIAPLLLLAGLLGILLLLLPATLRELGLGLAGFLRAAGRADGPAEIGAALHVAGMQCIEALAAPFACAILAGVSATLLQTGFLLRMAALQPDLTRLSPMRGLHRVFGATNLIQAGKSLLKATIVGAALWRLLRQNRLLLAGAMLRAPAALPGAIAGLVGSILVTALVTQAAVAVLDLVVVRMRHARGLRMSRTEIRDEARESNGNPEVKAKLRRLRAMRARHRMAQAVRGATVVVTNPTHYAVALAYDRSRSAAPRVVAKGMDDMAARIRAIAEEHRVPIVANPPLARALHRLELDSDIPQELYKAVAELIAYVWRLQGTARRRAP